MWQRWILACCLGEALGISLVAVTYAAIDRGLLSGNTWILLAGAWEGLCLGGAQALMLRTIGLRADRWIVATTVAAVLGYALSLIGTAGGSEAGGVEPTQPLLLFLGATMGAVMGMIMGGFQAVAGHRYLPPRAWIIGNAIGWTPAMAIIIEAAALAQSDWSLTAIGLLGAGAGVAAGLCIGAATGVVVVVKGAT